MLENDLDGPTISAVHAACPLDAPAVKGDAAAIVGKPGERTGDRRLTGTRFAHHAQDFAAPDIECHKGRRRCRRRTEQLLAPISYRDPVGTQESRQRCLVDDKAVIGSRHSGDQTARVFMRRFLEDPIRRRFLDDAALLQDGDPVGNARNQGKIMRDVQCGHARLGPQPAKQLEDARACDDVERGCRFVEHDQLGPAGEGGGSNHDALLLAARRLVRIALHQAGRLAQVDTLERFGRRVPRFLLRKAAVPHQYLADLTADRQGRIERGRGILEHHAHTSAANRLQRLRRGRR